MIELNKKLFPKKENLSQINTSARNQFTSNRQNRLSLKNNPKKYNSQLHLLQTNSLNQLLLQNESGSESLKLSFGKRFRTSQKQQSIKQPQKQSSYKINVSPLHTNRVLNQRIYKLTTAVAYRLYFFNLLMNLVWRCGLLITTILLFIQENFHLAQMLIGLFLLTLLVYNLAMIKTLYFHSDVLSEELQGLFFQKDATTIMEDKVWRRNFTTKDNIRAIFVYWNPSSSFNQNIQITILKQEIYKRIQICFMFVPFIFLFIFNRGSFYFGYQITDLIIVGVLCFQIIRIVIHYLIVYINS